MKNVNKFSQTKLIEASYQEILVLLAFRQFLARNAFGPVKSGTLRMTFSDFLPNSTKIEISGQTSGLKEEFDALPDSTKEAEHGE